MYYTQQKIQFVNFFFRARVNVQNTVVLFVNSKYQNVQIDNPSFKTAGLWWVAFSFWRRGGKRTVRIGKSHIAVKNKSITTIQVFEVFWTLKLFIIHRLDWVLVLYAILNIMGMYYSRLKCCFWTGKVPLCM